MLSILLLLPPQRHLWLRHACRRPKKRPSERLYPYELQHSRPHLMAPTTAHRKAWVLCTSATHLNFKAPKKELLYEAGLLAHYCKHSVRDKTNLKAADHTYTNPPPGQFVLLDLLAHRSAKMLIRLPSACRAVSRQQLPYVLCWAGTQRSALYLPRQETAFERVSSNEGE